MQTLLVVSSVVLLALPSTGAQILSYVQKSELEIFESKATSIASNPTALADIYFAVRILEALRVAKFSCNCAKIGQLLRSTVDDLNIYYGASAYNTCGCGDYSLPGDKKKILDVHMEVRLFPSDFPIVCLTPNRFYTLC